MSEIEKIKQLRQVSGAGFKDCNLALKESKGDIDNKLTIKMLASNIGKKSKFYDNTLTIEY